MVRYEFAFDCETDGFRPTQIHSLVLADLNSGEVYSFADHPPYLPIRDGLDLLGAADLVVGHNIVGFDLPHLKRLHGLDISKHKICDTLVLARVLFPDLRDCDAGAGLPPGLIGKHSLEAWGHRLNEQKDGFGTRTDWKVWTPEMQSHCEQDVLVTAALWFHLNASGYHAAA